MKQKEKAKNLKGKLIKGKFQGVVITAEKSHNRFVTKVSNLDYFGVD